MKTTVLLLLLQSCLFGGMQAQSTAKISGVLPSGTDAVKVVVDPFYLGHKPKSYSESGKQKFNFEISLDRNRFVLMRAGLKEYTLYLEPGDEISVDLSGAKPVFSGKGGDNNQLWQDFLVAFPAPSTDTVKLLGAMIDSYEMELFSAKKKEEGFLKKELKNPKYSAPFVELMNLLPAFRYRAALLAWSQIHGTQVGKHMMKRLPAVMEEELVPGPFEKETYMILPEYRQYLRLYIRYRNAQANGFVPFEEDNAAWIHLYEHAQKEMKGGILAWFLGDLLYWECTKMAPSVAKRIHTELLAVDKSFHYSGAAFENCGQWMNQKEEKADAGEFAAKSKSGMKLRDMTGKDFYTGSLKGKVVYIDIWASWCGPCRAQAPYAKALKEKLTPEQAKQIVFLYISIDDDETKWKMAVEQLELHGVQVISPGGWHSEICQEYNVTSIPRYMLMDKSGKIVDYNAKRPGDPTLFDDLINLLK